jgi:hypothetical protein
MALVCTYTRTECHTYPLNDINKYFLPLLDPRFCSNNRFCNSCTGHTLRALLQKTHISNELGCCQNSMENCTLLGKITAHHVSCGNTQKSYHEHGSRTKWWQTSSINHDWFIEYV